MLTLFRRFHDDDEKSLQVSIWGLPGFDKEDPSPEGDPHPDLHGFSLTNKNSGAPLFTFGVFSF